METANCNSEIFVGQESWLEFNSFKKNYDKLFVIVDQQVDSLYKEKISSLLEDTRFHKVVYRDMEDKKNLSTIEDLTQKALDFNLTRYDAVLAIGGGATGDLGGYFSSIYKRGIDFYNFPTTLMAQVDSSIGGKTAVNFNGIKNLLGTFHLAKAIFMDPKILETLDTREFLGGLGEIVKYALLDKDFFREFGDNISKTNGLNKESRLMTRILQRSVEIKNKYIKNDIHDTKGTRIALNLGHTLGHLIENKEPDKLNHGLSVIVGLDFALFIARHLNHMDSEDYSKRKQMMKPLLEEIKNFCIMNYMELFEKLNTDKKFKDNKIQFIVPKADGFVVEHFTQNQFNKYILMYSGDIN